MKNKTNKQFKLFARFPKSKSKKDITEYTTSENGSLIIEGVASTTNKDLQEDIVLPSAIESMKQQALSLNLHHDHIVEDSFEIIGAISEVEETDDNTLKIKSRIRPKYTPEIKEMLDTGINLGLSISGDVTDYTDSPDSEGWRISDINLFEISLTGMPANWDTFGTVTTSKGVVESTCLTGACNELLKNKKNEEKQMEDENKPIETDAGKEPATKQDVVDLINEDRAKTNEQIKSEIMEELTGKFEDMINEKLKTQESSEQEKSKLEDEEKDPEMKDPEKDDLEKACDDEEDDKEDLEKACDDEEDPNKDKSYTLKDIENLKKSWIQEAKKSLEEEVLNDLTKNREPKETVKTTSKSNKISNNSQGTVRKAKISEIAKEWGM